MARQRSKIATLLFATVYIGFLCLCQVACSPDKSTQKPEIDPDRFGVILSDATRTRSFVIVSITPGSSGMMLREFFVTASLEDNKGVVHGNMGEKKGGKLVYDVVLQDHCLEALFLQSPSNCLGKDDKHFEQGEKVSFRIEATPNTSIKQDDRYTLTVTVERKGSNPHTETKSIELTAKQDGVGTQEKTEEESTSGTSSETMVTNPSAVPDDATQPISQPSPNEAPSIPTEKVATIEATPKMCVSDTDLPATQNEDVPNAHATQSTHLSDSATAESSDNAGTSAQQPASNQFTVTTKDETQSRHTKNFVLVTIKPGSSGMKLKDFAVAAHLENDSGVVNGSSGRNGSGFAYGKKLNNCTLEELFLTNNQSNCLGKNDVVFARGGEVAFKIEIRPGATIRPGDQYTLTIKVARKGNNPHTETQSIRLTAPKASPSPRKRK